MELLQRSADLVDMMLPLSNLISTIQASYNFICDKHNCHVYGPSELHKLCVLLLLTVIFIVNRSDGESTDIKFGDLAKHAS